MRWTAVLSVHTYYHLRYRIRCWGSLPRTPRAKVVVANHQHENEPTILVESTSVGALAWRYPVFAVAGRRMFEPNFMAERIPWLRFAMRGWNFGVLFGALGLRPLENELNRRPLTSLAHSLLRRVDDAPLADVFRESALAKVPPGAQTLKDLLQPEYSEAVRTYASLSELREPYRAEVLAMTRADLDMDIAHFQALAREGATIFLTPEGTYSPDGRMLRLRGLLSALAPLAQIVIAGISYDVFVGKRLSLLYRLVVAHDDAPLEPQIKAARPVTVSALLATWLADHPDSFSAREAAEAVSAQLAELPPVLFVDPELRRNPTAMVHRALSGLERLGSAQLQNGRYTLTSSRTHPEFPLVGDMIDYQRNFHQETLEGARSATLDREGVTAG